MIPYLTLALVAVGAGFVLGAFTVLYAVVKLSDESYLEIALRRICDSEGRVCSRFGSVKPCVHASCRSSYNAWSLADTALNGGDDREKEHRWAGHRAAMIQEKIKAMQQKVNDAFKMFKVGAVTHDEYKGFVNAIRWSMGFEPLHVGGEESYVRPATPRVVMGSMARPSND